MARADKGRQAPGPAIADGQPGSQRAQRQTDQGTGQHLTRVVFAQINPR